MLPLSYKIYISDSDYVYVDNIKSSFILAIKLFKFINNASLLLTEIK